MHSREHLARPDILVDLTRIPEGASVIEVQDDGGLRIGGAVRLAQLVAKHRSSATASLRLPRPARASEPRRSAPWGRLPAIFVNVRGAGTCEADFACHKNGGDSCPAASGENQYHAIFGGGPCYIVHPSDAAGRVDRARGGGRDSGRPIPLGVRRVPIADFFVLPSERLDPETVLARGEYVSAIEIPGALGRGRSVVREGDAAVVVGLRARVARGGAA